MAMPDLNSLLAQAGAAPPGAGPSGGGASAPPPSIQIGGGAGAQTGPGPTGGADGPDSPESEQHLNDAIDAMKAFFESEQDAKDKATAAKVIAQLQGILGNRQGDAEAALGVTPQLRHVARQARRG